MFDFTTSVMILDDAKTIARIDKGNVRASIEELPGQVGDAWREAKAVNVPPSYRRIDNVVVAGMGGSTLGAHIIQSSLHDTIRVPFSYVNDYHLPAWVGKDTLVVLSSYSGTTEETLSCFRDAKKRGAKLMGITTGGQLARMMRAAHAPSYVFKPRHNPSGQPRMGLGYMVAGTLALLSSARVVKIGAAEMRNVALLLARCDKRFGLATPSRTNIAKQLARKLHGKVPIFIAGAHLVGNAHVFQNQVQESAKQFADYFPLPELNHHLMEGLKFPREIRHLFRFVFLNSKLYDRKLARRVKVTELVLRKQGYGFHELVPTAPTALGQAFEALSYSSALSFYMSMLSGVDPSDIPWVDFFKKALARG